MSLPIPHINRNPSALKRSGSASSLGNAPIGHDNDLAPVTRASRRGSTSSINTSLSQPPTPHTVPQTILYAGKGHKQTAVPTHALMAASPYFQRLLAENPEPLPEQTTFEDAEEASMALFGHYITGKKLGGPTDFHSCGHYLGLYVLGLKFGCEGLQNNGKKKIKPHPRAAMRVVHEFEDPKADIPTVIDLVRTYYHTTNITASPFRCQYIYTYTSSHPNALRHFLIATAAWRALWDQHPSTSDAGPGNVADEPGLSNAMKEVLIRDPSAMEMEFVEALIRFGRGEGDPRAGGRCVWHVHERTGRCGGEQRLEPWEKD